MMTRTKFFQQYCTKCSCYGCLSTDDDIARCVSYNGDIPDLPKAIYKKEIDLNAKAADIIEDLCKLSEPELYVFLLKFLKANYNKENVIVDSDYLIGKGGKIGLVAHMDTVFPKTPQIFLYDSKQNLMWSPDGAGFDDRAGVYAAIKLIQTAEKKPTVIFTKGEEKGGLGALDLIAKHKTNFMNLDFLIQLDRQGKEDCVFYDCANKDFEDFITFFGFKTDWGTFSDISIIAPAWGIAAVNVSVGYVDEHTYTEMLNLNHLNLTIERVLKILKDGGKHYKYVPKPKPKTKYGTAFGDKDEITCEICNKKAINAIPILDSESKRINVCYECFSKMSVQWCPECSVPFVADKCPVCGGGMDIIG